MGMFHIKILPLSIFVAGLVGGGLYLQHRNRVERQQRQTREILLHKADQKSENGRFEEAVTLYKEYLGQVPGNVEAQASFGLALEELADSPNEKQQALLVLERVLRLEPERSDLHRRVVGLLMDLGQHLDALPHLILLRMENPKDAELLELLGECYEATLQYRQAARAFESAIELEPDRFSCYRQLANLLHSELKQAQRVAELLEEMVAVNPQSHQAFLVRGRFRMENGMLEQAGEDFARCLQLAPDDADVLLANIEYEFELQKFRNPRSAANSSAIRNLIHRGLELYPSDVRFHEKLVVLELRDGNTEQAITALQKSVQTLPEEVNLIWILAELLAKSGRLQESSEIFSRLKKKKHSLEQDDYIDARLLWNRGKRLEAVQLLERTAPKLAKSTDFWQQVKLVLADYHSQLARSEELQGRRKEATAEYLRAIALGAREPGVILRATRLLASLERFEEADDLIRELEKYFLLGGESARLAAEVSLRTRRDPQRALDYALKAHLEDSSDFRDWLWLARYFQAADRNEGVENALRRAVELGRNAPEPWIALVRFLARSGRTEEAETAIEEARTALRPEEVSFALARCQEILGNLEEAEKLYEAARAARPDDLLVLKHLSDFHLNRGDPAKSVPIFERILQDSKLGVDEQDRSIARRGLAIALATGTDYQQFSEAMKILDEGGQTPEDRIARAMVLATRNIGRHRSEAIGILEELDHNKKLSADDRFLLAKLHDKASDWTKSRDLFRSLLRSTNPEGSYLAYYARALLLRGKIVEARTWCDLLAKREPQNPRTIRLQASLLAAQGNFDETIRLSNGLVMRKESQLDQQRVLLANAMFLHDLGRSLDRSINEEVSAKLFAEAEKLYRDQLSARPKIFSRLAPLLAHLGRSDEALDLCEKAWSSCSPDLVAKTCITILQSSNENTDERFRRVENQLKEAIDEHSEASVALQIRMAQLCLLQRRFEEATELYRRILAEDPRNIVASNNLAYLLAQDPQHAPAALELIESVIGKLGPTANFLDTRALVHIALGDYQSAIKDLEEALPGDPSPIIRFHLAWAYRLAGRGDEAIVTLKGAQEHGLTPEMLFPGEQKFYLEWTERMTR